MSTFSKASVLVDANKSNLFPILPSIIKDSRYPGTMRLRVSRTIFPGLSSVPSYESQGWTISAHPEGNHYAHTNAWEGITIVTEARILEPGVSDQLNAWLAVIRNVITEEHIHLPETSHLFLEIHQDLSACNYYFVNHARRTVFWLHTLDIIGIGTTRSFSNGHHLRHSLQKNYWIHVELFPETASEYSAAALDDLSIILLHARTDALASYPQYPEFKLPYTDEEREWLIDSLYLSKNHASSPYTTTCVARLWATVEHHRSFIHFGCKRCLILTIVSKVLLFGLPDDHQERFEILCVDQLICTSRWRKHVSETIGDLKHEMSRILVLLCADVLTTQISSFPALAFLSLILCIIGLTVTFVLLHEQRRLVTTNATDSAVYLGGWITIYGFYPIAIVHSLPQALFVWALFFFTIQHFWVTFANLGLTFIFSASLPVAAVLLVACVGI